MRRLFPALFFICCSLTFSESLYLVKDGRPCATIVISDDPSLTEKLAAEELALYLKKSTGAVLPILHEKDIVYDSAGSTVLVGATKKAEEIGATLEGIRKGGFRIKRAGNFLILRGEDDREYVNPVTKEIVPVNPVNRTHARHGTLYAVYDFLEKNVGVRWYWPGEIGEIVPARREISVDSTDYVSNPDFEFRYCYGWYFDDPDSSMEDCITWWLRQRWGSAGYAPATHALAKYPPLYGKTHPEYFALQKDGTRLTTAVAGGQICLSNTEMQDIIVNDIIEYFRTHPHIYTANMMPGDSFSIYCCQCPECRAKYREDLPDTGTHSHIVWQYVNEVARKVGRVFPDRYIACCAYGSYFDVPEDVRFEPNVSVTLCRDNADLYYWKRGDITRSQASIVEWGKKSNMLFTWEYPCTSTAYGNTVIFPHGINEEVNRMKKNGIRGTIVEYIPCYEPPQYGGHYTGWLTDILTTYALYKSLWDVNTDVDRIVDEYCRELYGPAAQPMKRFYSRMEEIWLSDDHGTIPYYSNWANIWTKLYGSGTIEELLGYLREAEKMVENGSLYERRLKKTIEAFTKFYKYR